MITIHLLLHFIKKKNYTDTRIMTFQSNDMNIALCHNKLYSLRFYLEMQFCDWS
jgi:hypothetical protein